MLSFLQQWNGHLNIFVQPTAGFNVARVTSEMAADVQHQAHGDAQFDSPRRVTSQKERDVAPDYFWKGNCYIVFRKDSDGRENFHFYRVDVAANNPTVEAQDLTPFAGASAALIDDLTGVSDTDILIRINHRNPQAFDACRLNVVNPDPTKIDIVVENNFGALDWVTDHSGTIRVAITRDGTKTTLSTRPDAKSRFTSVLTTEFTEMIDPQGFTPDDKLLYAISNIDRDKAALVTLDPASGRETAPPLFIHRKFDLAELQFSKRRKVPTDLVYFTWRRERKPFDDQTEKIFRNLTRRFPDSVLRLTDKDAAEEKYIVSVSSDRNPGSVYLYDHARDTLHKLADVGPSLKREDLAKVQPIQYVSDGATIHGYLTLPLGRGVKKLPAVILPHAGPWQRDAWDYDPDVQFLANRGYAVLQMDFRGSVGYGKDFWKAGFKEWGGKMQDDVTAGVKWLIERGTADPKRVAICGQSYGGYAALAGVTFTPQLYAAAADRAGISNLLNFLDTLPEKWKPLLPELYAKIGDPKQDQQRLAAHSPLLHAARIKVPVLLCHGRKDVRVDIRQSEEMVAALRNNGLQPEYLWFDNEGHYFGTAGQIAFHQKLDEFLKKHLDRSTPR